MGCRGMATQEQIEQNRQDFEAARSLAEAEGRRLCATYKGDTPVYFSMPPEASDQDVQDEAFRIREGRLPTEGERTIGRMIEKHKAVA